MMRILPFLLGLLVVSSAHAEIIPAARRMTWQGVVGVPGGITNRTTIYTNMVQAGADSTGVTNCSAIAQAVIAAYPSGTVIYWPAGTYKISGTLSQNRNNVTHRGAGIGKTVLNLTSGAYIQVGNLDSPTPSNTLTITGGATNGSTVLTLASAASVVTNRLITVMQTNSSFVHYNSVNYGSGPIDDGHTRDNLQAYTHKVIGKTGNTITIQPPLVVDLTNAPTATGWPQYLQVGVGFEDMTINMTNSTAGQAIWWQQTWGCWMKNVCIKYTSRRQVWYITACQNEVRDCVTLYTRGGSANHEGIDFYENCSFNLIENNTCIRGGYPMIILGDFGGGCSGNVVAYNYCADVVSGNETNETVAGYAISDNHGPHNSHNLFEGNIAQNFCSDGYFGSSSTSTLFRNNFNGKFDRSLYQDESAIRLAHWSFDYNVVGNVLGTTNYSTIYEATGSVYQDGVVWYLGYANAGNRSGWGFDASNPTTAQPTYYDTNVKASMLRHGNWDYATNTVVWDAAIADTNLINSYYLPSQPTWWTNLVWPSIGSDLTPMVASIPAKLRWEVLPPLATVPMPTDGATGIGLDQTLSWVADYDIHTNTYNIYFGTSATPPLLSSGYTSTSYQLQPLAEGTTYYWIVVPVNVNGTNATPATTWSFSTLAGGGSGSSTTNNTAIFNSRRRAK